MLSTPPVSGSRRGRARGRARGRRSAGLAVAAAAAAGLLAGCASANSPQAGSTPVAGQSTATAQGHGGTPSPEGTGAANPAATGSATPTTAPGLGNLTLCPAAALQVTVNASQTGAAMGSTYIPVDFTNTATTPCGLYGYPGMSLVTSGDGAGQQIGAPAQENPGFGKVAVRLAAGGQAHAWLQVTGAANYPSAQCQPVTAHWLRVYAPGETQPVFVNHVFSACSSAGVQLLTVMPVRSGQGTRGSTP